MQCQFTWTEPIVVHKSHSDQFIISRLCCTIGQNNFYWPVFELAILASTNRVSQFGAKIRNNPKTLPKAPERTIQP